MTEELKIEEQIQKDLDINIDNLAEELKNQPSTYYYYSCSWALASRKRRLQKMQLEETKARLGNAFKAELKEEDPKVRVSERMLDDYLAEQPIYQDSLKQYIQSEYVESLMEVAKDAFKARGIMLTELSRSHQDEKFYGSEYAVMKEEMERRDEKKTRGRRKREEIKEATI